MHRCNLRHAFCRRVHSEVWLSLVERYVRDVEVASSNLVTSTKKRAPPLWRCSLFACAWRLRAWLLPCNNASSVSPPEDRRACTPGAGRVNFRAPREYLVNSDALVAVLSFCLCVAFAGLVVALQQRKFGFTAPRSAGLHARRRCVEKQGLALIIITHFRKKSIVSRNATGNKNKKRT